MVDTKPVLPDSTGRLSWFRQAFALARIEGRKLAQNKMACLMLVLLLVAAGTLNVARRHTQPAAPDTCYVVYWETDDWVRRLAVAARVSRAERQLQVEVVPARLMADKDGMIRYPRGSHSIQIRPLPRESGGKTGWLIWYWYSGNDPTEFLPYVQWFQQVTHEHFQKNIEWEERFSPMQTELFAFGTKWRPEIASFLTPNRAEVALVWLLLFFVSCHLPKLSLAEAIHGRMVLSIAATPVGWQGAATGVYLFYGFLSVALAAVATGILQRGLLMEPWFWITILCATLVYLGMAVSIACWTGTVSSASLATIVYLTASAVLFAVTGPTTLNAAGINRPPASLEAALLLSLDGVWNGRPAAVMRACLVSIVVWTALWIPIGTLSRRRLARG